MGRSGRVGKRAGRVGSAETRRIPVIRAVSLPIPLQIAESVADSRPRFGEQTATAEGAFIQQTRASTRFRGRCCVATEEDPARRLPLRSSRAAVTLRSLLACAHLAPRVVADPSSNSRLAAPASARCPPSAPPRSASTSGRCDPQEASALGRSGPRTSARRSSVHARGARSAVVAQASCHAGRDCAAIRARPLPRTSCCAISALCAFVRDLARKRVGPPLQLVHSVGAVRAVATSTCRGHRVDGSAAPPQPEGGQPWPSVPLSPASCVSHLTRSSCARHVRELDDAHVDNLAQSIALRGLLVPLIVRPADAGKQGQAEDRSLAHRRSAATRAVRGHHRLTTPPIVSDSSR